MIFEQAYKIVYGEEGGYANEKTDTGGETYGGISRVHNPAWPGWVRVDQLKNTKGGYLPRYFRDAELDRLVKVYLKTKYWDYPKIDQYPAVLRLPLFDLYVNAGYNAFAALAMALGLPWEKNQAIVRDGKAIIKYNDRATVTFWDDAWFIAAAKRVSPEAFTEARKKYYQAIGTGVNAANLPGWLARADRVLQESRKFITENPGLSIAGLFFLGAAVWGTYKLINKK